MAERPTIRYNTAQDPFRAKYDWWSDSIPSEKRFEHIWQIVQGIMQKQAYRSQNNLKFAQLYNNMEIMGFDPGMFSRVSAAQNYLTNRMTLNVSKSCVDTITSKIAKSKPRPFFLTDDGDWQIQQRAKDLTRYLDGWFYSENVYKKGRMVFVDGCAFGTGGMKIYKEGGQVKTDRVLIDEIIVDEAEGIYGEPRQMHQRKAVFREVLAQAYPEHSQKIYTATSSLRSDYSSDYYADMIYVFESWHLPSAKDAEDGRHCITIDNCTLIDEPYTRDYFPFSFFRWCNPLLGFYGTGLIEELVGIQLEINKILRNIQISQNLMAVPQVWLEQSSQVVNAHINNEIGGIKRYVGTPPIFQVPQAMSPEIYGYLENLVRKAYQITGISEASAQAKKPSGVTAAVALQTLSDMETERFMVTAQEYEEFYLDLATKAIDMTTELYEDYPDLAVKAPGQEFMKTIKWKDVSLEKDTYVMRCFPTNLLPTQPAGKLERVQGMMQAGFLDRDDAISLLDYPDLKAVTSRITAPRDDVLKIIGKMLGDGVYTSPEPYMNLELAKSITQSEYNKAKVHNAPDDRLELLRRFMDDCQALLDEAQAALQEQQMAQQMAMQPQAPAIDPMAQPAAAPVSELLPIA